MVRGNDVAARIELVHEERGKVTDLATGHGGMETALRAIAQVMGIEGKLVNLTVTGKWDEISGAWKVSACVTVDCGLLSVPGSSVAPDVLTACCGAYMDALTTAAQTSVATKLPLRASGIRPKLA